MKTVAAFGIAIALVSPVVLWAVNPHRNVDDAASPKYYPMIDNVSDLQVWRINGKAAPQFSPDLLTKYLRETVDPKSWSNGAEMHPDAARASFVISQTEENHTSISKVISSPTNVGDFGPMSQQLQR
jgi:hypothetical protein